MHLGQSRLDVAQVVSLGVRGGDASGGESLSCLLTCGSVCRVCSCSYLVCVQALEQVNHLLEEVTHFLLGVVAGVAAGLDGVDASTVLAPLVLPELLVATAVADPVLVHVCQEIIAVLGLQDLRDVGVLARGIAVGLVGAVAVVGPEGYET